jgi:MtaA/CmuA family methyltransferase
VWSIPAALLSLGFILTVYSNLSGDARRGSRWVCITAFGFVPYYGQIPIIFKWLRQSTVSGRNAHAMTGRERILAVLNWEKADHLANMPITMMFAADVLGVKYGQYARDHKIMVDAQIKTAEMFGFDYVSTISDPAREAADAGAKVRWYDDQPPAIIEEEALFADKSALGRTKPEPLSGGRMEDRIRGIELLRQRAGDELFVEGWVEGPCAEAADLRGINRLMLDFGDDPQFVHELFGFAVETAIRFADEQIKAGADIIGIGDAAASLVGPRIYKEFVLPWEKKLVDAIHSMGGRVRLHICGNTRRILDGMGTLGCAMVDIDFPVPMEEARAKTGPRQTLAGNLNPVKDLRDGTRETITQALATLQQQAGAQWIVAAGCEIVRDTPHENVRALVRFAQTHAAANAIA